MPCRRSFVRLLGLGAAAALVLAVGPARADAGWGTSVPAPAAGADTSRQRGRRPPAGALGIVAYKIAGALVAFGVVALRRLRGRAGDDAGDELAAARGWMQEHRLASFLVVGVVAIVLLAAAALLVPGLTGTG